MLDAVAYWAQRLRIGEAELQLVIVDRLAAVACATRCPSALIRFTECVLEPLDGGSTTTARALPVGLGEVCPDWELCPDGAHVEEGEAGVDGEAWVDGETRPDGEPVAEGETGAEEET